MLSTDLEKIEALEVLEKKKEVAKDIERVNNSDLPAGAPMYYYCRLCGSEVDVLSETHVGPSPKLCNYPCQQLVDANWSEQEQGFVEYEILKCPDRCNNGLTWGIDYYTKRPRTCLDCNGKGTRRGDIKSVYKPDMADHLAKKSLLAEMIIPALPNPFPYNELLLEGTFFATSRNWKWGHSGPTLLYTTKTVVEPVARHFKRSSPHWRREIMGSLIGIGDLLPVKQITKRERMRMEGKLNCTPVSKLTEVNSDEYVHAGGYLYRFENLQKFDKPVPFILPSGNRRAFDVAGSAISAELRKLDIIESVAEKLQQ